MYRILVVEDDEVIAKTIRQHLQSWNYEVYAVVDFNSVMEEFARVKPHLVLMDIRLPFHNGFYWCTEIRKVSKLPIIFVSSMNDNMNLVMAINMGGDDFITKPFDLNVSAEIRRMCRYLKMIFTMKILRYVILSFLGMRQIIPAWQNVTVASSSKRVC